MENHSILFICRGNVCRSQMAQGWYNHYTQSQQAGSAGTNPISPHILTHPAQEAITVMAEEGIDISQQPVTALTPGLASQAGRIIVLCQTDECPDYVNTHPHVQYYPLPDPWGKNVDEFRTSREEIRLVVQALL